MARRSETLSFVSRQPVRTINESIFGVILRVTAITFVVGIFFFLLRPDEVWLSSVITFFTSSTRKQMSKFPSLKLKVIVMRYSENLRSIFIYCSCSECSAGTNSWSKSGSRQRKVILSGNYVFFIGIDRISIVRQSFAIRTIANYHEQSFIGLFDFVSVSKKSRNIFFRSFVDCSLCFTGSKS